MTHDSLRYINILTYLLTYLMFLASSVCMYVYACLSVIRQLSKAIFGLRVHLQGTRSSSYMKVIGRGQGRRNKEARNSIFSQCKTLIGNKSDSTENTAQKFACDMGVSAVTDRMLRSPSLSRDRKYTTFADGLP